LLTTPADPKSKLAKDPSERNKASLRHSPMQVPPKPAQSAALGKQERFLEKTFHRLRCLAAVVKHAEYPQ
jgi:hypothetical protein